MRQSRLGIIILTSLIGLMVVAGSIIDETTVDHSPDEKSRFEIKVTPLSNPATLASLGSRVVKGADGIVRMTWMEKVGKGSAQVLLSEYSKDGWTTPIGVFTGDLFVNWADFPSVAALENGALAVHWLQHNADGYGIRLARSSGKNLPFGPAQWLHDAEVGQEFGFASIMPQGGVFRAIWLDGRNLASQGEMQLRARTFSAQGSLGAEEIIDARVCECCTTAATVTGKGQLLCSYRGRTRSDVRDILVARHNEHGWSRPEVAHADDWVVPG